MRTVYLAGPITGLTFADAKRWREQAAAELQGHWNCLSPLRGKDHCSLGNRPLPSNFDGGSAAVRRDLEDIRDASALLLNLADTPHVSIGTVAELGYARAYGTRHIVTVLSPTYQERTSDGCHVDSFIARHYPNPHDHVFVHELSTAVLPSLAEAIDYLKGLE